MCSTEVVHNYTAFPVSVTGKGVTTQNASIEKGLGDEWKVGCFTHRDNFNRSTIISGHMCTSQLSETLWLMFVFLGVCMMTSPNGNIFRATGFCEGNHRPPVVSPHKSQSCRALIFSLICAWINGEAKNRDSGVLIRHRAHYDVTVMYICISLCAWVPA